jgi:hypothetical protein
MNYVKVYGKPKNKHGSSIHPFSFCLDFTISRLSAAVKQRGAVIRNRGHGTIVSSPTKKIKIKNISKTKYIKIFLNISYACLLPFSKGEQIRRRPLS